MKTLSEQTCIPCEGGMDPLSKAEASALLAQLDGDWELADDAKSIVRNFRFKGYARTMGFVNAVAWIAEQQGHHPDLEFGYGRCRVTWSTHAIDGLSNNDFICAARIDRLFD